MLVGVKAVARAVRSSAPRKLVGGVFEREHVLTVPVDWGAEEGDAGGGATMEIFVRELTSAKVEGGSQDGAPGLVYLQGGPGFASPRPALPPTGWLAAALERDHRVFLLDQRGTGRSEAATVARLGRLQQGGVGGDAERWLACMRADSIARDVDSLRASLLGPDRKIGLLGQSFGGFCALSYLSQFPSHCERALLTCGLPPLTIGHAREVYEATVDRMVARNQRFYARYPDDVQRVRAIAAHLRDKDGTVRLPGGGPLTLRRFQMLGLLLGSAAGFERLHWLLETAWEIPPSEKKSESDAELSDLFLRAVESDQSAFETNPIYYLLHEPACYADGPRHAGPTDWAAEHVVAADSRFDAAKQLEEAALPVHFTGEMVFSWMTEDFAALEPLAPLAEALAKRNWTEALFDPAALRGLAAKVPIAALVSYDDIYVERRFSEATADLLGPQTKLWVTNEFQHSGLRDDGARVFDTLFKMSNDEVSLPS